MAVDDWVDDLYRTERPAGEVPAWNLSIPYYLWNNRKPGQMLVWNFRVLTHGSLRAAGVVSKFGGEGEIWVSSAPIDNVHSWRLADFDKGCWNVRF